MSDASLPPTSAGGHRSRPGSSTAHARVAAKIRGQILSGELRIGDRLPTETQLSAHYQVGRNTAREALRALESQGLLTTKRGTAGGTFVAHPSPLQVSESLQASLALLAESAHLPVPALIEARELLEVPAAELAALRRSDEEVTALRGTLYDPHDVDVAEVFYRNRAFHVGLLKAAHNPVLELVTGPIFSVLEERIVRDRAPAQFWRQVDRDHRDIFGYVEARDQAGAREASRAHLRILRESYIRIDREESDSAADA